MMTVGNDLRSLIDADLAANVGYPKSRVVLSALRTAQYWRERRGFFAEVIYVGVGGAYKLLSEWMLGIELPAGTSVGPGLKLRHGVGIVVNPRSVIGANVMIRQGVTLGNRLRADDCPTIEDDVEIGVGAVIIGAVTVGRGARIGPNAVIVKDVPAGAIVYSPRAETRLPWGSDAR